MVTYKTAGTAKIPGSRARQPTLWVGLWVGSNSIVLLDPALILDFTVTNRSGRRMKCAGRDSNRFYNGLANSRFHTLLFGINNLCSGEMSYICAKPRCLGLSVQLLCNRYLTLNIQKMITITKTFRTAYSTLLPRKARISCTERISLTKECGWKDGDRGGSAEWKQTHGKKKARVCLDINRPSHGRS